jgi:Arc/MetJ family transcription regulator
MPRTNIEIDDEPLGRDEALALQGSGFDFTNDQLASFSDADIKPADQFE